LFACLLDQQQELGTAKAGGEPCCDFLMRFASGCVKQYAETDVVESDRPAL